MCCYFLRETARDRLLVRTPTNYANFEVSHSFLFEEEPVFAYKASGLIRKRYTGLWVVAYSERVVCVCAGLLMAVYG